MPPKPAIEISASTAFDLKAQLAQHTEEFERGRSGGKQVSAARNTDKKPTVWARQNKGVQSRSQRDAPVLEAVESDVLVRSREALERKAKIYDEMSRQVNRDEDDEDVLIDFDRKYWQQREMGSKKSQKRKQVEEDEDDPWVEHEDEFGRTRVIRKSQIPSRSPSPVRSPSRSRSPSPRNFVPRDPDQLADRSSILHYEADREIRTKGVGFYTFAKDEEGREEQLEKLNALRRETEEARKNVQSVATRRKAAMARNAQKIHARREALMGKPTIEVDEDTVTEFLRSVRRKMK
ncbi:hypothetical protein CLU79DRAFT_714438 [Phycomyces nitens]|nr:hypothetical protein CLU79DRAFT_714438 [Phycomyces nitens]